MMFVVVQVDEGGAREFSLDDGAQVVEAITSFGGSHYGPEVREALVAWTSSAVPGDWTDWPCGWVFAVRGPCAGVARH